MKKVFLGMLFALVVGLSSQVWAANTDNPIDGIFKSAYGDSITVEVPSNVSKSSDTDLSGDLTLKVDANTGYRGFNELADLKAGDAVRVEYTTDASSQRPLAVMISKPDSTTTSTTTTTTSSGTTSTNVPAAGSSATVVNTSTY
jgi:hypothetical protein